MTRSESWAFFAAARSSSGVAADHGIRPFTPLLARFPPRPPPASASRRHPGAGVGGALVAELRGELLGLHQRVTDGLQGEPELVELALRPPVDRTP